MAFEVFDDVAFYWFFQVLLGIFLLPLTFYKIRNGLFGRRKKIVRSHPCVNEIPDYIPTQHLVKDEIDSRFSLGNIFFAALWVTFVLMLIQLPKWHNREMTNFEPYEILEIVRGATLAEIKKAYRRLSLKYHPDRVRGDTATKSKAHDKFIMIGKAYQTLTDEKTRESYEKYGNPDGYQGMMVTVGLPSFLTQKDNELIILSVYFLLLVGLVVFAWFWWNRINKFHKSGVYKQSIDIYWRYVKHNMNHKKLVDILAASSEYRIMDVRIPNDPSNAKMKAIHALSQEITRRRKANRRKDAEIENIFEASYVKKACTLLTAHLMGLPVPDALQDEFLFVLQEAPRLLDVMIDMTLSRERFWAQGFQLIQVKQAIVQGVWPFESRLKQLPHWTLGIDRILHGSKLTEIDQLSRLMPKQLVLTLTNAYSKGSADFSHLIAKSDDDDVLPPGGAVDASQVSEHVDNAVAMVRMYPYVTMRYCARTYDEKEVFEGDIVTVTVELTRHRKPWAFDLKVHQTVEAMTPPERRAEDDENKRSEYEESHGLSFVNANISDEKRLQIMRQNAAVVHSNRFPFRVREKWMIILVDKAIPAVVDQCAVPSLTSTQKVDLRFRMNRGKGEYQYLLVAKCDSYLGADRQAHLSIKVRAAEEKEEREEEVDYEIPEEPETEVHAKWYYLWNENIWECILTLFLLYFIYLIIVSTSWGKTYVQPCADWVWDHGVYPVSALIASTVSPVVTPVFDSIHEHTGWDIVEWWNGDESEGEGNADDDDDNKTTTDESNEKKKKKKKKAESED